MSSENQNGLDPSSKESSSTEELFSGSLESPQDNGSKGSEPPVVDAKSDDKGQVDKESGDSDLEGIFTDLEKDIHEELKPHALNVKKKLQGYFTKKNQTISQELETLRKNQITDDLKRDYSTLYGWYDKIQRNPKEGLKELASQYGVSLNELVSAAQAQTPDLKKKELALEDLETPEDIANFAIQEARKAIEEVREKEVRPLKESIAKFEGTSSQRENIQHGIEVFQEASKMPGFIDESRKSAENPLERLSDDAILALSETLKGKYGQHPDALKNAFLAITAHKTLQTSSTKIKELEEHLKTLKENIRGSGDPPGTGTHKTILTPKNPEEMWSALSSEPLSG